MVTKIKTDKKSTKRRTKAFAAAVMGKPSWQILERVKPAAPEHLGIVLERDVAGLLVKTPWVLLMSHPGINAVSAAELAVGPVAIVLMKMLVN